MLPGSPISASYPGTVEARRAIVLGCDRVDTGDTWPAAEGAQAGRGDAPAPASSPRRRISAGCAGIAGPRMPTMIRRCGTCCGWASTRRTPGFCGVHTDGAGAPRAAASAIRSGAPSRRYRRPANPGPGDQRGDDHRGGDQGGQRRPRPVAANRSGPPCRGATAPPRRFARRMAKETGDGYGAAAIQAQARPGRAAPTVPLASARRRSLPRSSPIVLSLR